MVAQELNPADVIFACPVIDSEAGTTQCCGSRVFAWRKKGEEHRLWASDFIFEGKCDHVASRPETAARIRLISEANWLLGKSRMPVNQQTAQQALVKVESKQETVVIDSKAREALDPDGQTRTVFRLPLLSRGEGLCT